MTEKQASEYPQHKVVKTINSDWKFYFEPDEQESPFYKETDFIDKEWVPVALPHTWQTYETTSGLHPFILHPSERDQKYWWYGWGWYRKSLVIDPRHEGQRIFLEFDGVQKYCRVYVNGGYIGEHKGGFTSFSLEVTDAVRCGQENVIAVAVNNRRNDPFGGIPPLTAGNWNVYGGIYRDVRIVIKERLHIPFQGSAEHEGGTFITTPEVSREKAVVHVRTFVRNADSAPKACRLETLILDAEDRLIAAMSDTRQVGPYAEAVFEQLSRPVLAPRLWSPDDPYLYKVVSLVYDGDRLADRMESPLGFRWFHWDYEAKRLYLNGEMVHIHGTNRHQEYPWLGDAIPKWMHEADLRDIKYSLGHNFIRTCHYTQDKRVYELCDRLGFLVCEEVPNIKNIAFGEDVQRQQVIEMVRRDRNHPSIIMWSMGNETNHAANGEWAKEEDPTRIIHYRHVAGLGENEPHTHEQLEMENLLRCTVRGWYNADVRALEPDNGQHTGHEKWQHDKALEEGGSQRGRIDMNGVMWIYADHGADREYVYAPLLHVNPKGWVDAYREPKLMYHLWRAHWSDDPVVYIHPFDWTARYEGCRRDITVNSNCGEVELRVNAKAMGRLTACKENDFTVVFKSILVEQGVISAHAIRDGQEIVNEVVMSGPPARLTATVSHSELTANRGDIALVRVDIVDQDGNHVYGADNELHVEISGPGKLVCPERFVSDRSKCEAAEGTMYIDTPISLPVRTTEEPGVICVRVTSLGLLPVEVSIKAVLPEPDNASGITEPPANCIGTAASLREQTTGDGTGKELKQALRFDVDDIHFPETESEAYEERMRVFLLAQNPQADPVSCAFRQLLTLMVEQLHKDRGIIVADDYNFNVRRYNDCIRMFDLLDSAVLSHEVREGLKEQYAERFIARGEEIDLRTEKRRLMKLELNY